MEFFIQHAAAIAAKVDCHFYTTLVGPGILFGIARRDMKSLLGHDHIGRVGTADDLTVVESVNGDLVLETRYPKSSTRYTSRDGTYLVHWISAKPILYVSTTA